MILILIQCKFTLKNLIMIHTLFRPFSVSMSINNDNYHRFIYGNYDLLNVNENYINNCNYNEMKIREN